MAVIKLVKIGDIVVTNASSYSTKDNWGYVNYLDTGNITRNVIDSIQYIDLEQEKLPSRAKRKVKKNSIIYSTVRPNQLHYGIIKNQPQNFLVSTGFTVIDVDESKAVAEYVYYFLTQKEIVESLQAIGEQSVSTYPSIKPSDIEDIEIPLPSLDIQKKIVGILKSLDAKIESNSAINNNLLEQVVALYEKLVDEATTTVKVGDIAEKVAMGPFGSNIKVSTFVESGVPIISGNHLRGFYLEEPEFNYITEEHAERLKNSTVYADDIIFTHAGNIGQVAMIPHGSKYDRYVLSQRQFYLRCNTDLVVPEYVLFFFHSAEGQHELLSYANQTGVPSIAQPASNLKKIPLPLPSIEAQKAWEDTVEPLIAMYLQNRKESECLAVMRDGLLPKLMSGELDVSEVEI